MENNEIVQKLLSNYKRLVAYYPYPTGGYGLDNVIAETQNFNGQQYDEPLKNIINLLVQLGAAVAKCPNDNKTAVKVEVDEIPFPIYCYKYDGKFCITKEIHTHSQEIKIFWNIEY